MTVNLDTYKLGNKIQFTDCNDNSSERHYDKATQWNMMDDLLNFFDFIGDRNVIFRDGLLSDDLANRIIGDVAQKTIPVINVQKINGIKNVNMNTTTVPIPTTIVGTPSAIVPIIIPINKGNTTEITNVATINQNITLANPFKFFMSKTSFLNFIILLYHKMILSTDLKQNFSKKLHAFICDLRHLRAILSH